MDLEKLKRLVPIPRKQKKEALLEIPKITLTIPENKAVGEITKGGEIVLFERPGLKKVTETTRALQTAEIPALAPVEKTLPTQRTETFRTTKLSNTDAAFARGMLAELNLKRTALRSPQLVAAVEPSFVVNPRDTDVRIEALTRTVTDLQGRENPSALSA